MDDKHRKLFVIEQSEGCNVPQCRQSSLLCTVCKWLLLKLITHSEMGIICLVPFRHNVKYKTWISGYFAQVDTHSQFPVLYT